MPNKYRTMVLTIPHFQPPKMARFVRYTSILLLYSTKVSAGFDDFPVFTTASELPLDENGHLEHHWLLFPPGCINSPGGLKLAQPELPGRKIGIAEGDLGDMLKITDMCPVAVALEMGSEPKYYAHHNERFIGDRQHFPDWLDEVETLNHIN